MDHHRELELYLHLTESLNFGRTSTDCHVSPATLTRTIQRLERQAGARLLERGPSGVALTEAGARFAEYATDTLELWRHYRDAVGVGDDLSGRLSLFATVTACQRLVPDLLTPFRDRHPQVRLEIQTGDAPAAIARLDEGVVDAALAALSDRLPARLISREVARTPVVFAVTSDGDVDALGERAQRGDPTVPYVLPRRGLAREYADRWFRTEGRAPDIAAETDGHEALLVLVALGCGVGVIPRLVLDSSPARDRIRVLPVQPALPDFRIGLCVRRADLRRPLISALWSSVNAMLTGNG